MANQLLATGTPSTAPETLPLPPSSWTRPQVSQRLAGLKADFSIIRYAQCWEDADVLLEALDIQPGDVCLSIASAGDNTLAMLAKSPGAVLAIDLNPAQLACLELRVAAFRELAHGEMLELWGSAPSTRRESLYHRCRSQ